MEEFGKIIIPTAIASTSSIDTNYPFMGNGSTSLPIEAPSAIYDSEPRYTLLWYTDSAFRNGYTIELNDTIDHYDELIYYGSANRGNNATVVVMTEYPVITGQINGGGPYTCNRWETGNNYALCNGTQMWVSGNSGCVSASYYWGMKNAGTGFEANRYTTARNSDVHPYMIVGVKY